MGLVQYAAMCRQWRKYPPLHVMKAAQLGYEPPKTIEQRWAEGAMNPADFAAWCKMTGGRMANGQ